MKTWTLAIATTLCLITESGQAQTMFGGPDCGAWLKQERDIDKSWFLGYLSGLNVRHDLANLKPRNPLGKLDSADQAFVWMDNFCKANPLRKVATGGYELLEELGRK